jgi:hypothetical protein
VGMKIQLLRISQSSEILNPRSFATQVDFMIQDNLQIIDLTNCHRDENLPSGVTVYLVLANSDQIPQTFCFIIEREIFQEHKHVAFICENDIHNPVV